MSMRTSACFLQMTKVVDVALANRASVVEAYPLDNKTLFVIVQGEAMLFRLVTSGGKDRLVERRLPCLQNNCTCHSFYSNVLYVGNSNGEVLSFSPNGESRRPGGAQGTLPQLTRDLQALWGYTHARYGCDLPLTYRRFPSCRY
jgi:hypothetical protein